MEKTKTVAAKPDWKKIIMKNYSVLVVILMIIIFTVMEPNFLNSMNIVNLLSDSAPLMIMAAGMTPILILGSIDLSLGSMCSVANVLMLAIMLGMKDSISSPVLIFILALVITLAAGVAGGIILGLIHVKLKVPSFIASLAFMSVWDSVALMITSSPVKLPKALKMTADWYKIQIGPIGLPLILAILVILLYHFVLTRTAFGRGIFAIGGNERSARIAGIKVDLYKVIVFAMNGFCAALGAMFLLVKAKSSAPTVGESFTLMVISAVVAGGTSLVGGSGSLLKSIVGVFIISIIKNGMNMVGVNVYWQKVVYGIIILLAVAISVDRTSRSRIVK
ncbi:MAG: ABC transporter permease [Lachnospiraceae bacterium]|nr:ABC transporter permease [Lachnospiraceae bacterium]MDD3794383.1 ABC transporter permease [Lachnospiraceae bacterium]